MGAGYGQALYYPHIHFADENWLRVAALYFDTLNRIVPYSYATQDSEFVRDLNARTQFIRNLNPSEELLWIQSDFLTFARENLTNADRRAAIWQKLDGQLPPFTAVIHSNKFENGTLYELVELGLAKKPNDWNEEWHTLDPLAAVLYMTFVANAMAQRRGLPVVTDQSILQPLLRDFQSDPSMADQGAFALASLVIETSVPLAPEKLSAQQIAEFRESSEFERLRFYEAIREFSGSLQNIDDARALQDLVEHKKKMITDAVETLKMSYWNIGIASVTGLLTLSVPAWSVSVGSVAGLNIPVLTVGCLALGMAAQRVVDFKKAKRDSPWSYVLSLQRQLGKEDLLKHLQQGTMLI